MKKYMMTLAAAALLFAACDKIEPDADGRYVEYTADLPEYYKDLLKKLGGSL